MSRYNYDYYEHFEPSVPRPTEDGIKSRSQRGAFAKSWWATRWINALEKLLDSGRLSRGRSYARKGQVVSIEETKQGDILAKVQGSRPRPYKITLSLTPFTDRQWEAVLDTLAEQAIFTVQLLAGEMPEQIETAFAAAGVSLFPDKGDQLHTDCSCPDWANPCKHVAAVHYILGERFDEDPFLLFRLRGRTQEQIIAGLRARRAGEAAEEDKAGEMADEAVTPLAETLANFWDAGPTGVFIKTGITPPAIEFSVLKRLGQPAFMAEDVIALLGPAYRAISRQAIAAAYEDDDLPGDG